MNLILKLYHVVIALLYLQSKFGQIQQKFVYLSVSLAVIISLMPYHAFTDGNMNLA